MSIYKDALVITTLKRPEYTVKEIVQKGTKLDVESGKQVPNMVEQDKTIKEDYLRLSLPFRTYAQNIVASGNSLTYRLHDLSNENAEVLAKVSYRTIDHPSGSQAALDESAVAEAFTGNMGNDWSKIEKNASYLKHYSVTKEDALATYDSEGVKTPYNGADKDDVVKFTQWEDLEAQNKLAQVLVN